MAGEWWEWPIEDSDPSRKVVKMPGESTRIQCLVYAPFSFNGRGPAESCAAILDNIAPEDLEVQLHLRRIRRALGAHVQVITSIPHYLNRVPYRYVENQAVRRLDRKFYKAILAANPDRTVAYFWPDSPIELVRAARDRGIPTVREMINSPCAVSGPILDRAYERLGLAAEHAVTEEKIQHESAELPLYDFLFASNPEVESSLLQIGIDGSRILASSFGWRPERFNSLEADSRLRDGIRVLFVGRVGVRKGVPELLEAWRSSHIEGELVLAGVIEPNIADLVAAQVERGGVRHVGYVEDIEALYRGSDIFVFPTLEEGGPQVTYEAAGCGLPVITTPMGAARLASSGETGIIVNHGSVPELSAALSLLAKDSELRNQYGGAARARARDFDYRRVGRERGQLLRKAFLDYHGLT